MTELFRITKGLEIDEAVQILQGAIPPGSTADTDAAQRGSLYLDTATGRIYTKTSPGAGVLTWTVVTELELYNELAVSPTPPTALGNNSIALGSGAQTAVSAPNSLAIGDQSLARIPGGVVQASGRFVSSGDAQVGRYILRTVTVNGVLTESFIDGTSGSERLVLRDDSTWTFTITITGHRTDASDGHAGYKVEGVIYRAAGAATTALQGAVNKVVIAESNTPWDVSVTADTTNGALSVFVKGQAGKIVRWVVLVETVEVTN